MSSPALSIAPSLETLFARDVAIGLSDPSQKWLPSKYLYDDLGSKLFEAITALPEYGLTRADARILSRYSDEIISAMPRKLVIAELGSGSGIKTRSVLEAAVRHGSGPLAYHPIDISSAAIEQCAHSLDGVRGVSVIPQVATYLDGLSRVANERDPEFSLLLLFLGSTIGNFDSIAAASFLRDVRELLRPGDALLLGTDLVKPLAQMVEAYDDPVGVTAAFNMNLLGRINRELDAGFNLRRFRHEARFNRSESRIEMHLVSLERQTVPVRAIGRSFGFEKGETIWTEGSRKFRRNEIGELARETGFVLKLQWTDAEWPFAESLLTAC